VGGRRDLEDALRRAAARFVDHVLAIVEASAEPEAPRPRGPGLPRVRRRAASLEKLAASIVSVLSRRSGLAVSDIAGALGVTPREITRPITWLLARGRVTKVGERRGTRYSLARHAAPEPAPPAPAPRPRKPARPPPKKAPPRSKAVRKRAKSTAPTRKRR
jgi:DNA-binding transcriptional ArsR family regulator